MTISRIIFSAMLGMGLLETALAADTHYVAMNGQTPELPYTNGWSSAASNIQEAVIEAVAGDTVLVSNGVYATGVTASGNGSNRVYISKAITVRSANNDPATTIIRGEWDPDNNGAGPKAVRCVEMIAGASLIGFTLTNGAVLHSYGNISRGGGLHGAGVASNCVITGNTAWYTGAGASAATLINCTIVGNKLTSGYTGGALVNCVAYHCTIVGNSTLGEGAGCGGSTLFNCTLAGNSADGSGGGCAGSILSNCTLSGNSTGNAGGGGAAYNSTLYNCTLIGNSCNGNNAFGGGAYNSILYNCLIIGNQVTSISSGRDGGGANACVLYNCTVVGNQSRQAGGGVAGGTSVNSIVYFNTAIASGSTSNYSGAVFFTNSCTAPAATGWAAGNITNDPMFVAQGSGYGTNSFVAGVYRLNPASPCINAGTNMGWMTNACDLDNRQRVRYGFADMGCYEFIAKGSVFSAR